MEVRYFFGEDGTFLGGFLGESALALVPAGSIEVDTPPAHALDRMVDGVIIPYVEPKTLNQTLEEAFLGMLPTHQGQPYFTNDTIKDIMTCKVAIIDANKIDPSGMMAMAILDALGLPQEMAADKAALMAMFPTP